MPQSTYQNDGVVVGVNHHVKAVEAGVGAHAIHVKPIGVHQRGPEDVLCGP